MSWWQRIGGPNGITLFGWLLLSPISIFFTVEVVPEGYLEGWSRLDGYLLGTLSHLVTGLVLLVGKEVVGRLPGDQPKPLAIVAVMGLAGASRGLVTAFSLEAFSITANADYLDRIASGAALIIIWFTAVAVVVDSRQRYRDSYARLSEKLEQQRLLRERGSSILAEREQSLLEQVRQTLQESLRVGSKTDDIHNAVDQLVRPLSHNLAQSRPVVSIPKASPKRRISLWPIARSAFEQTPYSFGPVIFVAVLGTFYSKLWQFGLLGVLDSLVSALFIWFFFALGQRLEKFGWWTWLFWFAAGLSSGLATGLVSGVNPLENPMPAFYLSLNVVIPAVMVAFLRAYDFQAELNLAALEHSIEAVQWETAALRQQAWVQQKRIARFVHSDLQARIRAFALRLELSGNQPREADIEELRNECETNLALGGEYQDFAKFITELQELWDGVSSIELKATDRVMDLLRRDRFTQIALVEIVREAVSNSVKHGRADRISVELEADQSAGLGNIQVVVKDNGKSSGDETAGLGSQVLQELTLGWELTKGPSGATLKAEVPIRQSDISASLVA